MKILDKAKKFFMPYKKFRFDFEANSKEELIKLVESFLQAHNKVRFQELCHEMTEKKEWTDKYEELRAENRRLREAYQQYTTGKGRYYHNVWCNADRRKPMGCDMCSCTIGHELKDLRIENEQLKGEVGIENGQADNNKVPAGDGG